MVKSKKVWNPFKKEFWDYDNLVGTADEREDVKVRLREIKEEGKVMEAKSKKLSDKFYSFGLVFTVFITTPLILIPLLGVIGLILSVATIVLYIISRGKKDAK